MNTSNNTQQEPIVAPEFIMALQEDAQETLKKCMRKIGVPEEVMQLLTSVTDLGFYLAEYERTPDYFGRDKFDIEGLVTETVNRIAKAGGVFRGAYSGSVPRENSMLAEIETVEA